MSDLLTDTMLDPAKRVRYTLGLVLGVDEFKQEQTYLMGRDDLHHRALHGYGTVHGLGVSTRPTDDGVEVVVEPGLAVDLHGRHICVPTTQCAQLNGWLNREEVRAAVGSSPPDVVPVYVTLCYRECPTDRVPVAGGPCRSQDDTMVASRIQDDYELQLRLSPPVHRENGAVRQFAGFIRGLQVVESGETATEEEVLAALLAHFEAADLPASPPDSPPDEEAISIAASEADAIVRSAFRLWVTELRPLWMRSAACHPPRSDDDCVLLAQLDLQVEEVDELLVVGSSDGEPSIDVVEDDRPYLLTTQIIQELLLGSVGGDGGGLAPGDAAGGDLRGTYPDPFVRRLQGRSILDADPADGHVLTWVQSETRWEPRALPEPGGDGGITTADVARTLPTLPFATITHDDDPPLDIDAVEPGTGFRIWFHANAGPTLTQDNVPEIVTDGQGLQVFGETDTGGGNRPFLQQVGVAEALPLDRNVLFVRLRRTAPNFSRLRFRFNIEQMTLTAGMTLADWVANRPVKWVGHDGRRHVTVFVDNEIEPADDLPAGGFEVVAAGSFDGGGNPLRATLDNLSAQQVGPGLFLLNFDDYSPDRNYIVTGAPLTDERLQPAHFEVFPRFDDRGIIVRVVDANREPTELGFMVQIGEIA